MAGTKYGVFQKGGIRYQRKPYLCAIVDTEIQANLIASTITNAFVVSMFSGTDADDIESLLVNYNSGAKGLKLISSFTAPVGGAIQHDFALVGTDWRRLQLRYNLTITNLGFNADIRMQPDGSEVGCTLRDGNTGQSLGVQARANIITALDLTGQAIGFCDIVFIGGKWTYRASGIYNGEFPQVAAFLRIKQMQVASGNWIAGSVLELWGESS